MNGTKQVDSKGAPYRFACAIAGVLLLAGAVLVLSGCGMDGETGSSSIAYSWMYGPITFYTEDPAFDGQDAIYSESYVTAVPGTWYMEYEAWDGSQWWAEYEIYIDEGEDGGLFSSGDDGVDLYFELVAYSIGPSFYVWEGEPYGAAAAVLGSAVEIGPSGIERARAAASEIDRARIPEESGRRVTGSISPAWPTPARATTERHRGDGYTVELRTGRVE